MAALVESISGTTRIILAYNKSVGHAYTEVYLGSVNEPGGRVEDVITALRGRYDVSMVFTHVDTSTGDVWLNLDWGPDSSGQYHPGGPFFTGTKHIPLRIRDKYGKTSIRPPEGVWTMPKADANGLDHDAGRAQEMCVRAFRSQWGSSYFKNPRNHLISRWCLRPVFFPSRSFWGLVNLESAYLRKISPRTGSAYSEDLRSEFARNSSAPSHNRFSISLLFPTVSPPTYNLVRAIRSR